MRYLNRDASEEPGSDDSPDIRQRSVLGLFSLMLGALIAGCGGSTDSASAQQGTRLAASSTSVSSTSIPSGYTVINLRGGLSGANMLNSSGHAITWDAGQNFLFDGTSSIPIAAPIGTLNQQTLSLSDGDYVSGWRQRSSDYKYFAFRWHPVHGYSELSTEYSQGMSVNASGQVAVEAPNLTDKIIWDGSGTVAQLPGSAYHINDRGSVVGYRFVRLATGQTFALQNPPDYPYAGMYLYKINENDEAAGIVCQSNCAAIRWTSEIGVQVLPAFPAAYNLTDTYYADINDAGTVTGFGYQFSSSAYVYRGYVHPKGAPNLTEVVSNNPQYPNILPRSINNHGHVVGDALGAIGGTRGFIWSEAEGFIDLNSRLINAPPGMLITAARAINDSGLIVAYSSTGLVLLKPGQASNAIPTLGVITSNDPIAIGSTMSFSAGFTDADTGDTHTARWNWGDGTSGDALVNGNSGQGTATGSHTYAQSGVYDVTLTITDSTGKSASVTKTVVVYDPAGGFVTGGGWINSPPGAYKADTALVGRATYGFVSKYKKGATVPSGETEFVFTTAGLNFYSTQYDWLVIGGARAQYKGKGTINGVGNYTFLLTAVDGNLIAKGTPDRFRIKIWHLDDDGNEVVDYDNQIDTSTVGGASEGTAIGGGSIVIHK